MFSALQLAFTLHGGDSRKSSNVPMIAHMLSVCALVIQDGGGEDEAIAALLHDALEDKPEQINRKEIEDRFGKKVLEIIEVSTDTPKDYQGGPKPPWRTRKEAYLEHIRQTDASLLRVTVADKIDNARAILADYYQMGSKVWERFNAPQEDQIWYYTASVAAYQSVGFSGFLLDELRELVERLNRLSNPAFDSMKQP
ncbi:MAG: HD domain-containing protein [Anaerolineaceae bacterium]